MLRVHTVGCPKLIINYTTQLILLSGGSGKRLWPLSNNARSKQFLPLLEKEDGTMEYKYKKSFILGEQTAYYVSVGGSNAEVKNFAQGKTYTYTENNQSKTVTIPNVPLFYEEGLQPIKQTTCSIGKKDRVYYVDDNGKNIFLKLSSIFLNSSFALDFSSLQQKISDSSIATPLRRVNSIFERTRHASIKTSSSILPPKI